MEFKNFLEDKTRPRTERGPVYNEAKGKDEAEPTILLLLKQKWLKDITAVVESAESRSHPI